MKLTTKQLKQMIREELNEIFKPTPQNYRAKRMRQRGEAEEIDSFFKSKFDKLEASDDYADKVGAHVMAADLGSEEEFPFKPLEYEQMPLEYKASAMIPKYVAGSIKGIQNISPDRRIDYWQRQGVDLDQYMKNPMQVMEIPNKGSWEPMHITKEQLTNSEYKFLYDQLWTLSYRKYPKIIEFEKEMKATEAEFKAKIANEIQKHIDSGKIIGISIEGGFGETALYNSVPEGGQ